MDQLSALAGEAGLLVDWEDAAGRAQAVGPDTLRAVLEALGLPAATERQAAASRRRLAAARADEAADPDPGDPATAWRPPGAGWGVSAQLYSLRDGRETAFGDFTTLAAFADAAGRAGADAVAISPVHAPFLADPERYSPYGPSSRLFLNGLFADPWTILGGAPPPAPQGPLIDWGAAWPERVAALRAAFAAFAADDPRQARLRDFRAAGGADLEDHARFEALHARFLAESGARGWPDWPAAYRDARGPAVAAFAREQAEEVAFHVFVQWLAAEGMDAAQAAARAAGMSVGLIADVAVGMDPGGSHAWSRPDDLLPGMHVGAPPDYFQARGQDWGLAAFSPEALRRTGFEGFLATLRAAMSHAGGVRIDHILGLQRLWVIPKGAEAVDGVYLSYPFEALMRLTAAESRRREALVIGEDLGTVPPGFRERLAGRGLLGLSVLVFERDAAGFTRSDRWRAASVAMTTTHDLPTLAGWWRGGDIDWAARLGSPPDEVARRRTDREDERRNLWAVMTASGCASGPAPAPSDPAPAIDAAVRFVAAAPGPLALAAAEDLIGEAEQPNIPGTMDEHPNWRRRLPLAAGPIFAAPQAQSRLAALNARRRP